MELTDVVGVFCAAEERLKDPILQMLSRKRDAGFCIAIVKTVFTRTAEGLPIAAFNARLESCISYIGFSEECRLPSWCFGNGEEDVSANAKRIFDMLAKPIATGGYGWLRCERAEETLEETVFISMNGLSALDMYDRLGMEAKAFTGVKAEDFAYQMNDLTTLLTMDRRSRIRQLEERIAPYLHQIEILRAGGDMGSIENGEIEERLRHMYDIVTQMPTAIRRTRDAEKQAIEKLSENYRTGSMNAAASITQYTDTFVERFEKSDDGQSYSHASKTLFGLKDAGNLGTVLLNLCLQVVNINRTVSSGCHTGNLQTSQSSRCRVGAVRRQRNQDGIALVVAVSLVEGTDRTQTSVLTGRTRVRLQGHSIVTGNSNQPLAQVLNQLVPALSLILRDQRVDVRELGPGDGLHLSSRVQLHGARTQRNHGAVKCQVLISEVTQVAHHLGLGAVLVENRVLHVVIGTQQLSGQIVLCVCLAEGAT